MNTALDTLRTMPWGQAWLWLLLENGLILLGATVAGNWLARVFQDRPVAARTAVSRLELLLVASSVLLNTAVTVLGLLLWRRGFIQLRLGVGWGDVLDTFVLFFAMDLAMYVLHRLAHVPVLYRWMHRTHHLFEDPHPLTLFALNPFEVLSFGLLWLVVLCVYPTSWAAITVYLTLNVAFGLVGHLGVEPLRPFWARAPLLQYISTSTFHAQHHHDAGHNFGFYTLIWDRLFGTLAPRYADDFGRAR